MARASQKLFSSGLHASLKVADPSEGPSKTGFAPVVKGVLPDVVNISTSKVVRTSDQFRTGQMRSPRFSSNFLDNNFRA